MHHMTSKSIDRYIATSGYKKTLYLLSAILEVSVRARMSVLDVGSGDIPKGDVNCDLFRYFSPHVNKRGQIRIVDTSHNFVCCDAEHLPFKNRSFGEVFCRHVIEHVEHPYKLIDELIRVARNKVTVQTPHRFGKGAKRPYHINYFSLSSFQFILTRYSLLISSMSG
jgi:ubiquinone/menaquinone biosynthesis C-methylase UbiE